MNQIARCNWLPERARWSHLARSGLPAVSREQHFPKSHIINPLLTRFVRSRWLDIGLVLFLRVYGPRLHKHAKKHLANIQPSCRTNLVNNPYIPHKWIVLFARADWLARRWLAKYYSPQSSRRKTKWLLSVYCLGKHQDSRENKTNCFPRDHALSVYYYYSCIIHYFLWELISEISVFCIPFP